MRGVKQVPFMVSSSNHERKKAQSFDRLRMNGGVLTNDSCWREAQQYLVGGVNSPVRSFRKVGGRPFFVDRGQGPYLWDVEGKRYLDYVGSWGALILGHRPAAVLRAVQQALKRGTTFGIPTRWETELARAIGRAMPSIEQIRFVSSGTEAVMSAVRLARAATGRRKILKFDGAYHGHLDSLLTRAGSGLATLGLPGTPGVPPAVTGDTLTVSFNDPQGAEKAVERHRKELACILVEPALANIGLVLPEKQFLKMLRRLSRKAGALLIFDEVITGFRVGYGGAQERFSVEPDLTVLGKVIGGGFPIGAYGGAKRWMRRVAPEGPVYQAGTLAGHPMACAAGLATLEALAQKDVYARLNRAAQRLRDGLIERAQQEQVPVFAPQIGGLLSLFFTDRPVTNAEDARRSDSRRYARYFHKMLDQGIYLPPSPFEAWFPSAAHGEKELQATLRAHSKALAGL